MKNQTSSKCRCENLESIALVVLILFQVVAVSTTRTIEKTPGDKTISILSQSMPVL